MHSLDLTKISELRRKRLLSKIKELEAEKKQLKQKDLIPKETPSNTAKTPDLTVVKPTSPQEHSDKTDTHSPTSVIDPIDQLTKEHELKEYQAELTQKLTAQNLEAQRKELEQDAINIRLQSDIEEIKTNAFRNKSKAENEAAYRKERIEKIKNIREDQSHKNRINQIFNWFKVIILALLLMVLIAASIIGLYRFYRWATEEPLIKEIEKKVEIEKIVEKEIEVEKIIEKEVIPEECTQIRRNGQIFVSCDGVTIDGAPTISESGIKEIPDLVTD